MTNDLYETLGVDKSADQDEIKKAYRKKAMASHPDQGGDAEEFHALTLAYDTLSDDEARKEYDDTGRTKHDQPDNDRAIALSLIDQLVQGVLSEKDAIHVDIVASIKDAIQVQIAEAESARAVGQAKIEKCDRFLSRLKGEGPIRSMMENQKRNIEGTIKGQENRKRLAELALELVKDEAFDPEPRPAPEPDYSCDSFSIQAEMERQRRRNSGYSNFFRMGTP